MPPLAPYRPTPLTPDQLVRVRVFSLRVLAIATAIYLAWIAIALTNAFAPSVPIRQWWLIPVVVGAWIWMYRVLFFRLMDTLGLKRRAAIIPPYPHNLLFVGSTMSLPALAGVLMLGVVNSKDATVSTFIMVPGFALGITLIGVSNFSFIITPPSCPRCRYPLVGLDFPTVCPECAHAIQRRKDAPTFQKLKKPGLRAAGIACLLTLLLPVVFFAGIPRSIANRLPARAQFALAPSNEPAFNAVLQRGLTPDEHRRLADALLDISNTDDAWQSYRQLEWLNAEHAAGRLTPEQSDRFASDGYRFEIATDTPPRVGAPVQIYLSGSAPIMMGTATRFLYFVQSFDVDGVTRRIDDGSVFHSFGLEGPRDTEGVPVIVHTPAHPGPLTIRARVITITYTGNPPFPAITWHDDGTYTITPQPLTAHEFTAETTLQVEP